MAFKMNKPSIVEGTRGHRQALKLNKEMDKSSLPDGRPKSSAFQMAKKSPIEKELVGKQNNLPEGLKAKIEASPKESPAKMARPDPRPKPKPGPGPRPKPRPKPKPGPGPGPRPNKIDPNKLPKPKRYGNEKSPAKLMRKKLKTSGATLINTKKKKRDDTVKKAIEAAKNAAKNDKKSSTNVVIPTRTKVVKPKHVRKHYKKIPGFNS